MRLNARSWPINRPRPSLIEEMEHFFEDMNCDVESKLTTDP